MLEAKAHPATKNAATDPRVRKRVSIGLSPGRPTAQDGWQRPPERAAWGQRHNPAAGCLLSLLAGLIVATVLLIAARFTASPTLWPQVQADALGWLGQVRDRVLPARANQIQTGNLGTLRTSACRCLVDDFTTPAGLLARHQENDRWWLDVLPDAGVYRMLAWPQHVAWSTLGLSTPKTVTSDLAGNSLVKQYLIKQYKVESSLQITPQSPEGYGGLVARFQNERSYYLFAVDGQGRFQVQLLANGILSNVQPWTTTPAINHAGQSNLISLMDDSRTLQFFVNGVRIYTLPTLQLPAGDVGVFVGAPATSVAVVNFDWIGFYAQ